MGIINFHKIWWYATLHIGSMQREFVEQWYHDMWFVLDIWGHFVGIVNFHKIGWYMALHVGSMQSEFVEQMMSWHVVCVGHLRNFVRGKYGQQILCHIFEDHTRNYFATRETHEFNISHKKGNRNPAVMGLGKLAPPMHHPLEVEFSRSKLPLSQFVNPQLYMGTSISYPIYRIYIPMFIDLLALPTKTWILCIESI